MVLDKGYQKWRLGDKSKYSPEENKMYREMHERLVAEFSRETNEKPVTETEKWPSK